MEPAELALFVPALVGEPVVLLGLAEDQPTISDDREVDLGRMSGAVLDDFKVRGEREPVAMPGAEPVKRENGHVPVEFQGLPHSVVEVVIPLWFADRIAPAGLFEEVVPVASNASEGLPDVVDGVPVEPVAAGAAQDKAAAQDPEAEKPVASAVGVEAEIVGDLLRVTVRDDGVGGASLAGSSGLAGLKDRVEALGGRIVLHSPLGAGTSLRAELPLTATNDGVTSR